MLSHRSQILERLRAFPFEKYNVRLCVLYGSFAKGEANDDSDIDLAFLLADAYPKLVKLDIICESTGILGSDKVDLLIINDAMSQNPLVVSRALTEGVTVFEESPGVWLDLHLRARKLAGDARYLLKIADEAKRGDLDGKEEKFLTRLGRLEQDVEQLKKMIGITVDELSRDTNKRWALERGMHVVIEGILDLGEHVLASDFNEQTSTYRQTAEKMAQKGIVTGEAAKRLPQIASFRNILVHEYVAMDLAILAELFNNGLSQLEEAIGNLRSRSWENAKLQLQ